jgi:hypothetical protein
LAISRDIFSENSRWSQRPRAIDRERMTAEPRRCRASINTSLILFGKMAAFAAAVSRGLAADVVISGVL